MLEKLAGEPWYQVVSRLFWKPLGMSSTVAGVPALTATMATRLSSGHKYTISPDENQSIGTFSLTDAATPRLSGGVTNGFLGAGSIISSVVDYCKWMRFLIATNSSAMRESQARSASCFLRTHSP